MNMLRAIALVSLALVVAGCSRTTTYRTADWSVAPQPGMTVTPMPDMTQQQPTADVTPIQQASLNPGGYEYLDGAIVGQLSDAQRSAANNAQFYALQFGRPGAPRDWSAGGASGQVTVGPYVTVNSLDCREFSHRVTFNGQTYTKSGTACREASGAWSVTA